MRTKENTGLRASLQNKVEEIKSDYLSGIKVVELGIKYGVSEATMRRFLRDNEINLGRRNLKDPQVLSELKKQIEELLPTTTVTSICKKLKINHSKYMEIMNKPSKSQERFRNDINESFINLNNPDFCYLLGFFMADGHIDNEVIYISQSDAHFLHKLQKIIGHNGKLKKDSRSTNPNYILVIQSQALRELLINIGVETNKKFSAPYIDCKQYARDFVRGVFDGDGCISYTYISGRFSGRSATITSGSESIIIGVSEFLKYNGIDFSVKKAIGTNGFIYNLIIGTTEDIIKTFHILYDGCNGKLDRKYFTFLKFERLVKLNQEINEIVDATLKDVE